MSTKKLSDRMIAGWKEVNGVQCFNAYARFTNGVATALCALGAANVGSGRFASGWNCATSRELAGCRAFELAFDIRLENANDEGLLPEELIGMLQSIGH